MPLLQGGDDWMITYNNVLIDRRDEFDVVYMPVYHVPELDRAAARVYRDLGFEVRLVDVSEIFRMGGALRCVANVTRRTIYPDLASRSRRPVRGTLTILDLDGGEAQDGPAILVNRAAWARSAARL